MCEQVLPQVAQGIQGGLREGHAVQVIEELTSDGEEPENSAGTGDGRPASEGHQPLIQCIHAIVGQMRVGLAHDHAINNNSTDDHRQQYRQYRRGHDQGNTGYRQTFMGPYPLADTF